MSKGGSTTSQVQIPQYLEDAARRNLSRASQISNIGYTPYFGADVAAMTPMQQASMQGTNQMASAFGLPSVSDPMAGMPQAQDFGGMQAYSSAPMYEQSLQSLAQNRPEQYQAIESMFNPTGGTSYGGGYGGGSGYGTTTSGGGVSASDVAGTALGAYGAYKAFPAVASKVGGLLGLGSGAAGTAAGDAAVKAGGDILTSLGVPAASTTAGAAAGQAATLANPNVAFSNLPSFANSALAQGDAAITAGSQVLNAGNANLTNLINTPSVSLSGTAPSTTIASNFGADPNLLGAGFENLGSSLGTGTVAPTTTKALGAFGTGGTSGIGALPTFSQLSALAPYAAAPFLLDPIGKHVISPIADALGFGSKEREARQAVIDQINESGVGAMIDAQNASFGGTTRERIAAKTPPRNPYQVATDYLPDTDEGRLEAEQMANYYQTPRGKAEMNNFYAANPEFFTPTGERVFAEGRLGDIDREMAAYYGSSINPQSGVGVNPMNKYLQMSKAGNLFDYLEGNI